MQLPATLSLSAALIFLVSAFQPGKGDEATSLPLETVEAIGCTECHREVALEWAESLHARAWVDPIYQKSVKKKRRPSSCYGCHIPAPLHLGDLDRKPKPRSAETEPLEHGISCESCHLGPDGSILGPFGAATEAHVSTQSPSFGGAGGDRLCASCHSTNIGPVIGVAKDFITTGQADRGRSCVGCHMSVEFRKIADYDQKEPLIERKGRNHRINGPGDPEFLERAFELSVNSAEERTTLTIANGAGHRVPGLIGRRFELTARLLDESGQELETQVVEFDTYSYLDVSVPFEIAFKTVGSVVAITGLHYATEGAVPVTFLDVRLP